MKNSIFSHISLCLVLGYFGGVAAMDVVVPPALTDITTEILHQQSMAQTFVESKYDVLRQTAKLIPANVCDGLARFLSDPRARRLFVDRAKKCIPSWPVRNRMKNDDGMRTQLLEAYEQAYRQRTKKIVLTQNEEAMLLEDITQTYGLTDFDKKGHNFVFASPLWPGYLVKIAKYRWVDNDAMIAFPYQLISRVFYNTELNTFISENGYDKHILYFPKSLYHIPDTPEDLNDDNYIVVEPLIPCPSEEENLHRFSSMTVSQIIGSGHLEYFIRGKDVDAIIALIGVIQYCGLWSISPTNIFLLDNGKIALVDTERPGLGGSEWRFFFHQDHAEISRNAASGFDGLIADVLKTKQSE